MGANIASERKFKSNNNLVYSCKYHVVWCPKYRRKVLVNGVDTRLKAILSEVAAERHAEIIEMEVMPDHTCTCGAVQVCACVG